jgi:hypothetical protein
MNPMSLWMSKQIDANLERTIPRNGCLVKDHRPLVNTQDET